MTGTHPWSDYLNTRRDFKITCNFEQCDLDPAPHNFNDKNHIRSPDDNRVLTVRETITMDDVIEFREGTKRMIRNKKISDNVCDMMNLEDLSLEENNFRVLYRYTDRIKRKTLAVLEAIHFEIFMPDRPDLRFITIPLNKLPEEACEGDYFEINDVKQANRASTINVGAEYEICWTVTQFNTVDRQGTPAMDYIYVAEKVNEETEDRKAVCNWTSNFIRPRHHRFSQTANEKIMGTHLIYDANLIDTSSAWVYPVEPPKNREEYAKLVQNVRSTSHFAGTFAQEISVLSKTEHERIHDRLNSFNAFNDNMDMAEQYMLRLFQLGVRFRQLTTPPPKENVFIQNFDPPRLQVYTEVFYLDSVTLHFEEHNIKINVENIKRQSNGQKKNTHIHCLRSPELLHIMGDRPANIWVDATFHGDGGSATEKILDKIDIQIATMEEARKGNAKLIIDSKVPRMIEAMYGNSFTKEKYATPTWGAIRKKNGEVLTLNVEQNKAMEIYHKIDHSGFCILSPPGSGKTTVAAAMAASLVKAPLAKRQGTVQMLLAVQNVAVENLASALKSFDDGSLRSYRLLSNMRTDPSDATPYDIFDHFSECTRWMKNAKHEDVMTMNKFFDVEREWKKAEQKGSGLGIAEKEALKLLYTQSMFRAKATLEKYLQPDIILSTVDLALYRLLDQAESGIRGQFWDVDRIIIDEASLLTESTFYCLIRCFPKASFVLIGDDKQLPPFMYEEKVLGHEIAGRAALNVALQGKNMPIIQLVEVYRAPQQLVQPYNNLSYSGKLVSRKKETCRPLLNVGLVPESRPDLLLVDIPKGHQRGSPSAYNEKEINVLIKLLALFPKSTHDDIMIICLYKAQKKRLQRRLGPDYEIMTVDSSQGKEKPIVIVLTTRTEKVTDFFSNQNRCTVAVSRHQRALIILGNNSLLSYQLPWKKVLEDFTRITPDQIPLPAPLVPLPSGMPASNAWRSTIPSLLSTDFPSITAPSLRPLSPPPILDKVKSFLSGQSHHLTISDFPSLEKKAPREITQQLIAPTLSQLPPTARTGPTKNDIRRIEQTPMNKVPLRHLLVPKKTSQQRKEQRRRAKARAAGEKLPPSIPDESPMKAPPAEFALDSSDFPSLDEPVDVNPKPVSPKQVPQAVFIPLPSALPPSRYELKYVGPPPLSSMFVFPQQPLSEDSTANAPEVEETLEKPSQSVDSIPEDVESSLSPPVDSVSEPPEVETTLKHSIDSGVVSPVDSLPELFDAAQSHQEQQLSPVEHISESCEVSQTRPPVSLIPVNLISTSSRKLQIIESNHCDLFTVIQST